jgi:hypothetical protein
MALAFHKLYIMLKITVHTDAGMTMLKLEGRLVGPWVNELETLWQEVARGKSVTVSLEAVSFIDDQGKDLLARMQESGVELVADGCMTKAIVNEIRRRFRNR